MERIALLKQLEDIKDNYESMLAKSDELIGEHLSFYLQSEDVIVEDVFENNQHILKIRSKDSDWLGVFKEVDLLITRSYSEFHRSVYKLKLKSREHSKS